MRSRVGYFAVGIQGFVVAALLIARQGGRISRLRRDLADAVIPGDPRATAGAGPLRGLYPSCRGRYQPAQACSPAEREPLRGILAMPAGVAASILLSVSWV